MIINQLLFIEFILSILKVARWKAPQSVESRERKQHPQAVCNLSKLDNLRKLFTANALKAKKKKSSQPLISSGLRILGILREAQRFFLAFAEKNEKREKKKERERKKAFTM